MDGMKSKEIYALVGAIVLILIIVLWVPSTKQAGEVSEGTKQEETGANTRTQTRSTGSSLTKLPTSVNPTVVPEKPVPTVPTAKSLAGSSFRLATYNGTSLPADSKFTLTFTETSFTLKLCNNMGSTYYITGNTLKANNIMSTAM